MPRWEPCPQHAFWKAFRNSFGFSAPRDTFSLALLDVRAIPQCWQGDRSDGMLAGYVVEINFSVLVWYALASPWRNSLKALAMLVVILSFIKNFFGFGQFNVK
jgi:hypothetical protein